MLFKTSTVFKENLEQFPSTDGIERIDIYKGDQLQGTIENVDGQRGSLALYLYLHKTMGAIDYSTARRGLELYAEHTADAMAHPGKHPNIDRLLLVEATHEPLDIKIVYGEGHQPQSNWDDKQDDE